MTLPYCIQEVQQQLNALPLPNPKFLADFLVGLITCQRGALKKIANPMPAQAKPLSQEQRIRGYSGPAPTLLRRCLGGPAASTISLDSGDGSNQWETG